MTDELKTSVELAMARLDARPDPKATCWQCGHEDVVPPELAKYSADPEKHTLRCNECGAVTAYGSPQPRIKIIPHEDRRFVVTRVVQGKGLDAKAHDFVLERGYAAEYAMELLSVCDPVRWRAVLAISAIEAATRRSEEEANAPRLPAAVVDEGGRTLDAVG